MSNHELDVAARLAAAILGRTASAAERVILDELRRVFRERDDDAEVKGARWMQRRAAEIADARGAAEVALAIRVVVVPRGLS